MFLQEIFQKSDFFTEISTKFIFFIPKNPKRKKMRRLRSECVWWWGNSKRLRELKMFCFHTRPRPEQRADLQLSFLCERICCCHSICKLTKSSYESAACRPAHSRVITVRYLSPQLPKTGELAVLLSADFSFLYSYLFDQVWIRIVH